MFCFVVVVLFHSPFVSVLVIEPLKICQKLQYREKSSSKQIKNKHSTFSLYPSDADLNYCVAASVDHSYHDMSNWIETSKTY